MPTRATAAERRCILKSNIVNPGKQCPTAYSVQDIAQANVDVFMRVMPLAIRSANFLSGGQSLGDASARLSAMNKIKGPGLWNLSFSWSAALQMPLFALCQARGLPQPRTTLPPAHPACMLAKARPRFAYISCTMGTIPSL